MYCPWHFGIGGDYGFGLLEKKKSQKQSQSKTKNKKQKNKKTRGILSRLRSDHRGVNIVD
jgi:hypothetical protein